MNGSIDKIMMLCVGLHHCAQPTSSPRQIVNLLTQCRRECRDIHGAQGNGDGDGEALHEFGGTGDFLEQPFGFRLPVCSLREGYSVSAMARTQVNFYKSIPEIVKFVPAFTELGFQKTEIPEALYETIVKFRQQALENGELVSESADPGVINGPTVIENKELEQSRQVHIRRTQLLPLDEATKEAIFKTLGPAAEAWSGLRLVPTSIYGIRRYRNMSTLLAHVDQVRTHVVSAILNIAQEAEEAWPLYIRDNEGGDHQLVLGPGEMVWYESARSETTTTYLVRLGARPQKQIMQLQL